MASDSPSAGSVEEAVCRKCTLVVKDKGISCDGCHDWYHIKCVEMCATLYGAINKHEKKNGPGLYWFCSGCNMDIGKLITEMQAMKTAMDNMERNWEGMKRNWEAVKAEGEKSKAAVDEMKRAMEEVRKEGVESVKRELEDLKREGKEVKKSFAEILKGEEGRGRKEDEATSSMLGKACSRKLQMEVAEAIERDKRRNKLVIMGVPEEEEAEGEKGIIRDIVDCLLQETRAEFVCVGRIGRKGVKPRPLRIIMEDNIHRRKLLARAKGLKGLSGKEAIYIMRDMTAMEQLEDKKLRDEVRRRRDTGEKKVHIVRGVVVSESSGTTESREESQGIAVRRD